MVDTYKLLGCHTREMVCERIHELPDESPPWEVVIRKGKTRRSTEQNALMWRLIRAISQGDCVEQTKDRLLMKWAGYEIRTLPDGTEYPIPSTGGSSKLTVEEMGEFITWLQSFMSEWGIDA